TERIGRQCSVRKRKDKVPPTPMRERRPVDLASQPLSKVYIHLSKACVFKYLTKTFALGLRPLYSLIELREVVVIHGDVQLVVALPGIEINLETVSNNSPQKVVWRVRKYGTNVSQDARDVEDKLVVVGDIESFCQSHNCLA